MVIILKLHVDRVYILQDIAIFIFSPFGLKLPIHAPFGGVLGDITPNEFRYCCKLAFDLLTLKVVSESRVTWATSVPILAFLWAALFST